MLRLEKRKPDGSKNAFSPPRETIRVKILFLSIHFTFGTRRVNLARY